MQLMRVLGRSLVDCFSHYAAPLTATGCDYGCEGYGVMGAVAETFERAWASAEAMRFSEARPGLETVVETAPHFAGARLLLAAVLSDLGQAAAARDLLDGLLVEAFGDGRLWFLAGQLAERCGQVERAIECYDVAVERGGRCACEAAERLAAVYVATGDYERAREKLAWLAEARPEDFCVRVELAGVLAALEDNEAAIRAYQDAILMDPDDWEVHKDLAAALEAEERFAEALGELRLVLDDHPYLADVQLRAAKLCGRLKDHAAALCHVDAALEANARYLEAIVFKGMLLTEMGDAKAALASFHRAIEINDGYVVAYAGLALALERCGRSEESAETLELARTIAPGSESIYVKLADVGLQMALASRKGPVDAVERAVTGDRFSGRASASEETGDDEPAGAGDHDELIRLQLEKHGAAVARFPGYADLRYYYGLLLSSLGRSAEALEQYRAAAEINPDYTEALVRLALAYWQHGRADEARHALAKAASMGGDALRAHYRFGLLWADRGLWPLTLEKLEGAVTEASAHAVHSAMVAAMQNLGVSDGRSRRYLSSLKLTDFRDRRIADPVQR